VGHIVTANETGFFQTHFTLKSWLEAWCAKVSLFDEIYDLGEIQMLNPFTKMPMTVRAAGRAKGIRL